MAANKLMIVSQPCPYWDLFSHQGYIFLMLIRQLNLVPTKLASNLLVALVILE
jgi:hypothetical protein